MNRNVLLCVPAFVALAFASSAIACGDYDDSQAHALPSALVASAPAASKLPTAPAATKTAAPKAAVAGSAKKSKRLACEGSACDTKGAKPVVLSQR